MAAAEGNGSRKASVSELRRENTVLRESATEVAASLDLMQERLVELELGLEDRGWRRLGGEIEREFSREALRDIAYLSRLYYLKNPLIRRAVDVQRFYVFGQGVTISASYAPLNDVVQAFWDDRRNAAEITSHQAQGMREVDLQLAGNVFLPCFTDPVSGRVRVRSIPFDEIAEVIKNPDDRNDPWFYRRDWMRRELDSAGKMHEVRTTAYYPALGFRPAPGRRIEQIDGKPVKWDAPVLHVKVGGTGDMTYGVPEVYPALDWAKAVKQDLEDYATLKRALARYAWNLTVKGGAKTIAAAKAKIGTTLGSGGAETTERNPPGPPGATFISAADGAQLAPMKTAGAQPTPEEGRAMRLMVAAAVGVPETILMGDADVGNLATAKTLDRPTELKIEDRQELWTSVFRTLLDHAARTMAEATSPVVELPDAVLEDLAGTETPDTLPDQRLVITATDEGGNPYRADVDVDWPPVVEHDQVATIEALVKGATLGTGQQVGMIPRKALARKIMATLDFDDIDALLDQLWPEGSDDQAVAQGFEPAMPLGPAFGFGGDPADPQAMAGDDGQAFAAALREFRDTIAPMAERWVADHPERAAAAEELKEYMAGLVTTVLAERFARLEEASRAATTESSDRVAAAVESVRAATTETRAAVVDGMTRVAEALAAKPIHVDATTTVAAGAITHTTNLHQSERGGEVVERTFERDDEGRIKSPVTEVHRPLDDAR